MKAWCLIRRGGSGRALFAVLTGIAAGSLYLLSKGPDPVPIAQSVDFGEGRLLIGISPGASSTATAALRAVPEFVDTERPEAGRPPPHVFSIPHTPIPIQFPDGEFISVQFRRVPPVSVADLSAVSARLISEAQVSEADVGKHAFGQYQIAVRCLAALQGAQIPGATEVCIESPEHYVAERDRSLRRAADSGHVHAVRLYAEANMNSDAALDLFDKAWHAGYIWALGQMADRHFKRSLAGEQQQDDRLGLAYLWLQAHLQDAAAGEGRRLYVAELVEKLRQRQQRMDASDVEVAMQMAKAMLRENVHCCFGP